jgi:hypothetical protein
MLATLANNPMLPVWLVLPLSGIALLTIGGHLASLGRSGMQGTRRRIRTANGWVLLVLAALLTYALGFVDMLPSGGGSIGQVRAFVLVWMAIMGLVPLVLALAGMDVANTMRMRRAAARELRRRLQMDAVRDLQIKVHATLGGTRAGGRSSGEPHGR